MALDTEPEFASAATSHAKYHGSKERVDVGLSTTKY